MQHALGVTAGHVASFFCGGFLEQMWASFGRFWANDKVFDESGGSKRSAATTADPEGQLAARCNLSSRARLGAALAPATWHSCSSTVAALPSPSCLALVTLLDAPFSTQEKYADEKFVHVLAPGAVPQVQTAGGKAENDVEGPGACLLAHS